MCIKVIKVSEAAAVWKDVTVSLLWAAMAATVEQITENGKQITGN